MNSNRKIISFTIQFVIALSLLFISTACNKKKAAEEGTYYTCPMHPDIKKDAPGSCPICGMDLVRKQIE